MTDRIRETFDTLTIEEGKALIAYIMAGDPDMEKTRACVDALVRGGADIIELGMPFSDPIADGPAIQKAAHRALKSGTNIAGILSFVRALRKDSEIPIVLMGYVNPVLAFGVPAELAAAGQYRERCEAVVRRGANRRGERAEVLRRQRVDWDNVLCRHRDDDGGVR